MTVAQTRSRFTRPSTVNGQLNQPYHWCSREELKSGSWVSLIKLPSPMSGDEAMLLCQEDGDLWRVWIPNHGEAIIDTHSFAC